VRLRLGNNYVGDGTFQSEITYPAENPTQIVAANLVVGGRPDLVFADSGMSHDAAKNLDVLEKEGDGTFQRGFSYEIPAWFSIATGDFNGDGPSSVADGDPGEGTGADQRGAANDSLGVGNSRLDGNFIIGAWE